MQKFGIRKKEMIVLAAVCVVCAALFVAMIVATVSAKQNNTDTKDDMAASSDGAAENTEQRCIEYYAFDRSLDENLAKCKSNVEIAAAYDAARQDWEDYMQECLDTLLASNDAAFVQSVETAQEDWLSYYEKAVENEAVITGEAFGSGSIRGILLPEYHWRLVRSRALELYALCCQTQPGFPALAH